MPIPLWTIPDTTEILGRPRREPLYDTEGDNDAVAIVSKLSFFTLLTTFQVASLSLTGKVAGRDTNMQDQGRMATGEFFHWYSCTAPTSVRVSSLLTAANVDVFAEIITVRQSRGFVFKFGQTPYIIAQLDEIPLGVGVGYVTTTHPGANVFPIATGRLRRENRYDVTLNGFPTELTQREKFSIEYQADAAFLPTPSVELWHSPHLWGTHVVGIRG